MSKPAVRRVWEAAPTFLMTVAAVLLIVVAAKALIQGPAEPPIVDETTPRTTPFRQIAPVLVDVSDAILAGKLEAAAAMIVYSDFECPYCGTFARDVAPALWREYVDSGQLLIVFRHLVLERAHANALGAAQAAECAHRWAKFWEMHDALFRDQRNLDEASLSRKAGALGLDADRFQACMNTVGPERIRKEGTDARKLGVTGTPSFLFGLIEDGKRVRVQYRMSGARPVSDFQAVLRRLLAQ
jgi:protein-disulfide isomerase